jgi:hypothetical protein
MLPRAKEMAVEQGQRRRLMLTTPSMWLLCIRYARLAWLVSWSPGCRRICSAGTTSIWRCWRIAAVPGGTGASSGRADSRLARDRQRSGGTPDSGITGFAGASFARAVHEDQDPIRAMFRRPCRVLQRLRAARIDGAMDIGTLCGHGVKDEHSAHRSACSPTVVSYLLDTPTERR